MNEKQFARLKQLCAETGNGDHSTDEEWGELALDLTHDMVAEIGRLREALDTVHTLARYRAVDKDMTLKQFINIRLGRIEAAAVDALKGGGDE